MMYKPTSGMYQCSVKLLETVGSSKNSDEARLSPHYSRNHQCEEVIERQDR